MQCLITEQMCCLCAGMANSLTIFDVLDQTFCALIVSAKPGNIYGKRFLEFRCGNVTLIISIQPEGRFWQEPEPSQATVWLWHTAF